jgi:Xaa-Pro dipeptidase
LPNEYLVWCGAIHPPSSFQASYAVDEVFYVDDLATWLDTKLKEEADHNAKIHVMSGVNSDSGLNATPAKFNGDQVFWDNKQMETSVLYNLAAASRVIKNNEELSLMHYVAVVGSNAHVEVMRQIKSCEFEYELEAKFLYEIYKNGGCRKSAYTSICACGPNSAVLHYGHSGAPNNRELSSNDIVSDILT